MSSYLSGNYSVLTDKGRVRKVNEDSAQCAVNAFGNVLLVIADGMGGATKGDVASSKLVEHLIKTFRNLEEEFKNAKVAMKWLNKVIEEANAKIFKIAESDPSFKGMGTTLVMAVFFKDNIYIANIGDSRCYVLDQDKITQLTRDQTYVEYLAAHNKISEDEKLTSKDRHALMNFVGKNKTIDYEFKIVKNERKVVLLCSDGLYNNASEKQIFSALNSEERLDQKISTLIGIAKANGGTDNIAVSLWEPYKND